MVEKAYPIKFILPIQLSDGTIVQLRPIHVSDGKYAASFKAGLSRASLNSRFFGHSPKITESIIKKYVDLDYKTQIAIIAEKIDGFEKEIIGIGRLAPHVDSNETVELAVIISDSWQGKGLGKKMTTYLVHIANSIGFINICAYTYKDNIRMIEILKCNSFQLLNEDYNTYYAFRPLDLDNAKETSNILDSRNK